MKKSLYITLCLLLISCGKENSEEMLINKLESRFGPSTFIKSNNELFNVYEWNSIENEIGVKFKNEIDKNLNSLPIKTETDFDINNKPSLIIDTYQWETPKIFIELKHSFGEFDDKQIHSKLTLKVNKK